MSETSLGKYKRPSKIQICIKKVKKEYIQEAILLLSLPVNPDALIHMLRRVQQVIPPNTNYVLSWKSKGLSAETIKSHTTSPLTASNYNLVPTLSYCGTKTKLKFTGSYLK